jgi:leucyl aminopeptidase
MNFELKTLDAAAAANHKTDALIVLLSADAKLPSGAIAKWVVDARKAGDLDDTAGKLLTLWHPQDVQATRLVLVSTGDGQAARVRQAVTAAMGALKSAAPKHVTVCLPDANAQSLQAVAQAVADASYTYTATKPSAKAAVLKRVVLALPTAAMTKATKPAFEQACAQVAGVALAKEMGNLPANVATPTHLGKVAQGLA